MRRRSTATRFFWGEVKPYSAFDNAADYRRYLGRLADVPRYFDENIANMRAGMKRGYTVPRATLKGRDTTIEPFTGQGRRQSALRCLQDDARFDSGGRAGGDARRGVAADR